MSSRPKGSHFCALASDPAEAFDDAAVFLKKGLDAGHRCVFIADAHPLDDARAQLRARSLDVQRFERAGQLAFVAARDTPLKREPLAPEKVIASWRSAVETALSDGFPALRVVVEMTWALDEDPKELARYERDSASLFADLPLHALCLYDKTRFSAAVIDEAALRAHPQRWTACGSLERLK